MVRIYTYIFVDNLLFEAQKLSSIAQHCKITQWKKWHKSTTLREVKKDLTYTAKNSDSF